uniref:Uncharacterized protein n=1 Tax=Mucochytrium quahogii TaxID=96639 RepID=A0A7S2WNI7_9STRA
MALENLGRTKDTACVLAMTRMRYMYTFPLAIHPEVKCNGVLSRQLREKSYLGGPSVEQSTKVIVPWFLLRPDLVTLETLAQAAGVETRFLVTIGHDPANAAFSLEGCPRFNTILDKRYIYKERLLMVSISDLTYQVEKLKHSQVIINRCENTERFNLKMEDRFKDKFEGTVIGFISTFLNKTKFPQRILRCRDTPNDPAREKLIQNTHMPSIFASELFQKKKLKKTVFATSNDVPTLVFIAGVEGTGHHMASTLGARHSFKSLYLSLTQHLAISPWDDQSLEKWAPARENLLEEFKKLKYATLPADSSSSGNVFFLNTVSVGKSVNMYSYPWGGPRCYLKRFARSMCTIDLLDLASIAEEAGIDFRVVVIKRELGASIVSAVRRGFGTFVSQTRMLGISWAILRQSLRELDDKFYQVFSYEELTKEPGKSYKGLKNHLNINDDNSQLAKQFNTTLWDSFLSHGMKDPNAWMKGLDPEKITFMSDMLYMSTLKRITMIKQSQT